MNIGIIGTGKKTTLEEAIINKIQNDNAWDRINDYIKRCNYTWTFEQLKDVYQKYYEKDSYTSHTFRDILNQFPSEMEYLFHS